MRFSPNANLIPYSGRLMRGGFCVPNRVSGRALLGLLLLAAGAAAQTPKPAPKKAIAPIRANELTLGGLRPGKDTANRALALHKNWPFQSERQDSQLSWHYPCILPETLTLDIDSTKRIQVIRLSAGGAESECEPRGTALMRSKWQTGLGLRIRDLSTRVAQLYGKPDSLSPSTRDGQPLELWYYAFDWAGPDVPQVMEVLCTKEKDGKPGQVIEITLAAPSL